MADKIVYKDGDRVIAVMGKIIKEDDWSITIERDDRISRIAKQSIVTVDSIGEKDGRRN